MLVRELFRRASILLKDVSPQFRRWTEAELVGWANDGQNAIAKYLPSAGGRIDVIRLQPGSRQHIGTIPADAIKPGDGSAPAAVRVMQLQDVVRNMGAGEKPGAAVSVVSRETLDAYSRSWHAARAGKEIEHYTFDPRTPAFFYVYPPVGQSAEVWVEVSLLACPPAIPMPSVVGEYGADGDSEVAVGIADQYGDDLLNYVLARAWMKDSEEAGNAATSQMYANLFLSSINAQAQVQTGNNPNLKMLPFAPATPAAAS